MAWPYPRIVAHRGGGKLAPENTLGAIRFGAALGFRAVEFDVMLALDGTPMLIHDETTDRTTGVKGRVPQMRPAQLEGLDAGNGEGIPRFEKAGELCRKLGLWANVEIKPAAGHERETGCHRGPGSSYQSGPTRSSASVTMQSTPQSSSRCASAGSFTVYTRSA